MSATYSFFIFLLMNILSRIYSSEEMIPKKDICRLPSKSGRCLAYMPRYFFNSNTKSCQEFIYGGCGGNDNRFGTKKECERVCIEGTDCVQPENPIPPSGCRYNKKRNEQGCPKNDVICDVKPGNCPTEYAHHCARDFCSGDGDCEGDKKCCEIGCSIVCLAPVAV